MTFSRMRERPKQKGNDVFLYEICSIQKGNVIFLYEKSSK